MAVQTEATSDEYSDTFAADMAAEISSELFSPKEPLTSEENLEEPAAIVEEVKPAPTIAAEPAVAIVPGVNSEVSTLPKAWKKDMGPVWEKLPPEAKAYVHAREADVMRGFQQYQPAAQAFTALTQPFQAVFQQNPDVSPVALFQGLMNTHLQLLNPQMPLDQKQALFKQIAQDYGLDFSATTIDPNAPAEVISPEVTRQFNQLQRELAFLKNERATDKTTAAAAQYEAGVANQLETVKAFAADPKNLYFNEVGDDIFHFIKTGAATDLAKAYELACYANPTVRAKLFAAQQTAPIVEKPRAKTGQFINIEGENSRPARTRPGTIDQTIDALVADHYSPKH